MIMLSISTSISVLLAKEMYFSRLTRLSQVAYYAADDGLMCATSIDDKFIDPDTGLGIFQYDLTTTSQSVLGKINTARNAKGLSTLALSDIKCATAAPFDQVISELQLEQKPFLVGGVTQNGVATTFKMKMDLGGGEFRCADVTVNKTPTFRQIIARGFATCGPSVSGLTVERAIISTSASSYYEAGNVTSKTDYVFTSGNSWTVPFGVTSIKVWAVGAGGGGAGTPAAANNVAGGGGAAGGTAYKLYTVVPGQAITFALGAGGLGTNGATNGGNGGNTTVTISGYPVLTGEGGQGGLYNAGTSGIASGGSGSGGDSDYPGGEAESNSGDKGGTGGAGINDGLSYISGSGCGGGDGAQGNDYLGMMSVVAADGIYPTVGPGSRGSTNCSSPIVDNEHGTNATGFGSGGGGAGRSGGNGGNGMYGAGGGGAAGGNQSHTGGNGGGGAVVISTQ